MCSIPDPGSAVPTPPIQLRDVETPTAELNRMVLSHEEGLEKNLSAILKHLETIDGERSDLKKAILAAQKHALGLKLFLSNHIPTEFYNERRSASHSLAVVQQTFNVVELLEIILDYVEIPDIVNLSQVNRSLSNSIKASSKLRDRMSLRPALLESHIYSPFETCLFRPGGFRCTLVNVESNWAVDALAAEGIFHVEVRAYFFPYKGQHLPKIGSTYRSMFVTELPIKEIGAYTSCCLGTSWGPGLPTRLSNVSSENGLTIGHLYDQAQKLMEEHRCCPLASANQLDDDGVVKTEVHFRAIVVVPRDRPIQRDRRVTDKRSRAWYPKSDAPTSKLIAYTSAKMRAHTLGYRIPSLQEFEAASVGVDWDELAHQPLRSYDYLFQEANEVSLRQYNAREAKLRAYGAARMQAFENGEVIPTLHEFEARNVGIDWLEAEAAGQYHMGNAAWPGPNFGPLPPPPPPMPNAASQSQLTIAPVPPILPPTTSNNIVLDPNVIPSTGENHVNNSAETDDQSSSNDATGYENAVGSRLDLVEGEA